MSRDEPYGIRLPDGCPSGTKGCLGLARCAASADDYVCIGRLDPELRDPPQDEFRLCHQHRDSSSVTDNDYRDLIDTVSVIMQGLSAVTNLDSHPDGPPAWYTKRDE